MQKQRQVLEGLDYPENYGPYACLAYGEVPLINVEDITKENWNAHYYGLLNILKDGIEKEEIQSVMFTINFTDGCLDISIFDYFVSLMFWYMLIAMGTPICKKHVFFAEEITQNTIKDYIDEYLIEEYRTTSSNMELNNIIDDVQSRLHDLDHFAMMLSNTLCQEDNIALAKASPEFRRCLETDFTNIPLEDVTEVSQKVANESIDIIKHSKELIGYDHCLADAFRAKQGINPKQYREFGINIGTKPDGRGGIWPAAINKSFINGGVDNPLDYFIESSAGRIAQVIKLKNTGESGQFARILGLNNMDSRLHTDETYDCHSMNFIKVKVLSKFHLKAFNNRYYRLNPNGVEKLLNAKKDVNLIGQTIYLRSPITCASAAAGNGICYKCYGRLAYTVYDRKHNFGINIGRVASDILSSILTQMLLSAKHLLESNSVKVNWCAAFSNFFEIEDNIIKLASELDYKNYRIQIDPENIGLENDEDADLNDEDTDTYNEYITSFDVVNNTTGEEIHIDNDKSEQLFITKELNMCIRKKGEPIDGKISINFSEVKDANLFIMSIENNELTKTLKRLMGILNKKDQTSSYPSISDLYQDLIDATIEANMGITGVHLEVILSNQLRDTEDMFSKPKWWNPNPAYNIITLNEALTNNPSVVISLSYQKIKKAFYNPLTFKKHGASFMDLFFMETPQRVINDMPEEVEFKRKPGEIVDPFIPLDDAMKITVASVEEEGLGYIED